MHLACILEEVPKSLLLESIMVSLCGLENERASRPDSVAA